jgi:hypothetical protein
MRWFKVYIRMGLIEGKYAIFNTSGDCIERDQGGKMLLLSSKGADQLVAGLNEGNKRNA